MLTIISVHRHSEKSCLIKKRFYFSHEFTINCLSVSEIVCFTDSLAVSGSLKVGRLNTTPTIPKIR